MKTNNKMKTLGKYFGVILTALLVAPFALLGLMGIFAGTVIKSFALVLLADPDAAMDELRRIELVN